MSQEKPETGGATKPAANGAPPSSQSSQSIGARKFSPLTHLTAQSARFGLWEVMIYNPLARTREYIYNKEKRISHHFQCMLVSTTDPTQYVLGDSHGIGMNAQKLQQLESKFKAGLVFEMSKVAFADNTNRQYNSAPKTEVVSMAKTTFSPILVSAGKPSMPEPAIPVGASMNIGREQNFDALALIHDITEMKPGGTNSTGQKRVRCTITLIDGSTKKDTDKVCLLPVTVFADENTDGRPPPLFEELQKAAADKKAVAVFGIQGKKSESGDDTWSFASSFSFHFQLASETTKGKKLEATASELLGADAEAVPPSVLQSRSADHNTNFADTEAIETTCALFKTLMAETQLKAIESENTFWQINWCQVHPPDKFAQVCTNDGTRLWMQVRVEDKTGHLNIWMREKAALNLAATETKEDFEAARADDNLDFPKKASIKIIRKTLGPQTPTADSSAEKLNIQCYIVEAAEQAMDDTPSKRSLDLLRLLQMTDPQTNACVPAGISMIKKHPHYGLSVSYVVEGQVVQKNCIRAIALVIASSASKSDNMNDGYQMVTEGVKDALDEGCVCTLMSFCTVKASPDYQLKPARGQKTQTAFVTIADVLEAGSADKPPVFLVESLEKIPDADATSAPDHMRRLLYFASLAAKMQGTSSKRLWSEDMSPANAGRCRRLGKSPTDELLEKYNSSA